MPAWTDDDIARLKELAAKGISMADAAQKLDRTTSSVQKFASKNSIRFHGKSGRKQGQPKGGYQPATDPEPINPPRGKAMGDRSADVTIGALCDVEACGNNHLKGCTSPGIWGTCADRLDGLQSEADECDLPCAVDPCSGVEECDRDDDEPDCETRTDAECASDPHDDCPVGYAEGVHVEPKDEYAPRPTKQLSVTVEVSGLPEVKRRLVRLDQVMGVLCQRIVDLEYERVRARASVFGFRRATAAPYELTRADIREWADGEVTRHEREQFRRRMNEAIAEIESAIFDEPEVTEPEAMAEPEADDAA